MSRLRISLLVGLCTVCVLVNCSPRRDNTNPWGNVNIYTPDDLTDITPYDPNEFAPAATEDNQWRKSRLAVPMSWAFDVQNQCPPGKVWRRKEAYCANIPGGDDEYGK